MAKKEHFPKYSCCIIRIQAGGVWTRQRIAYIVAPGSVIVSDFAAFSYITALAYTGFRYFDLSR